MNIGDIVVGFKVQLNDYQRQLAAAQSQTEAATGAMGKAVSTVQSAFKTLAKAGVLALGYELYKTARVTTEFEQAIANAASVSGSTRKELAALARELGKNTVYSAKEAADAEYYLASAGLKVEDMAKVLPSVLNLAAGTQYDLAEATDSVLASLKMFGLGMEDTGRVTNLFAAGISTSQATMDKLSASMRYAGPIASQVGMSIESTVAVLDQLYNAGYRGEQAGTVLRGAFTQLLKPTAEAQAILARAGITLQDLQGALKDPVKLVDLLAKANLSAADAAQVFGARALGFTTVIKQGSKALQDHIDQITGTNKADQLAAEQVNTMAGSLKLMRSAFEELQITLGGAALPTLRAWVDQVREGIIAVNYFVEKSTKGSDAAQSLASAFVGSRNATSEMGEALNTLGWKASEAFGRLEDAPKDFASVWGPDGEMRLARKEMRAVEAEWSTLAAQFGIKGVPLVDFYKAWRNEIIATQEAQKSGAETAKATAQTAVDAAAEEAAAEEARLQAELRAEEAAGAEKSALKALQDEEDLMREDFKTRREEEATVAAQQALVNSLALKGDTSELYYARLELQRQKDLAAENNAIRLRTRNDLEARKVLLAAAKADSDAKRKMAEEEFKFREQLFQKMTGFILENAITEKATLGSVAAAGIRAIGAEIAAKASAQAAYYGALALAGDPAAAAAAVALLALAGTAKFTAAAAAKSIEADAAKGSRKGHAYGGLAYGPTAAMIGERGPELVLPPEMTRDFLTGQKSGDVSNNYGNNDITIYVSGGEGADTGRQVADQLDAYYARLGVRVARESR